MLPFVIKFLFFITRYVKYDDMIVAKEVVPEFNKNSLKNVYALTLFLIDDRETIVSAAKIVDTTHAPMIIDSLILNNDTVSATIPNPPSAYMP